MANVKEVLGKIGKAKELLAELRDLPEIAGVTDAQTLGQVQAGARAGANFMKRAEEVLRASEQAASNEKGAGKPSSPERTSTRPSSSPVAPPSPGSPGN